jgi:hypothetical protein
MKRQTRPFTVEIRNTRKPATQPASSFMPHDDWRDLVSADDLSERDFSPDLALAPPQGGARRYAATALDRLGGGVQLLQPQIEPSLPVAVSEPQTPRVLPDLLAAARELERTETAVLETARYRAAPNGSTPKRPRKKAARGDQRIVVAVGASALEEPLPMAPRAPVPVARVRSRSKRNPTKLPAGERWKERRLPRACWERRPNRKGN